MIFSKNIFCSFAPAKRGVYTCELRLDFTGLSSGKMSMNLWLVFPQYFLVLTKARAAVWLKPWPISVLSILLRSKRHFLTDSAVVRQNTTEYRVHFLVLKLLTSRGRGTKTKFRCKRCREVIQFNCIDILALFLLGKAVVVLYISYQPTQKLNLADFLNPVIIRFSAFHKWLSSFPSFFELGSRAWVVFRTKPVYTEKKTIYD